MLIHLEVGLEESPVPVLGTARNVHVSGISAGYKAPNRNCCSPLALQQKFLF